ncbi:MAG: VanW family protein [Romboutsia sp.]|uniref:VanW family protein n=1 Tax=Romboutsia sp. TaxID=1965302 RepID=UPI003F3B08B4
MDKEKDDFNKSSKEVDGFEEVNSSKDTENKFNNKDESYNEISENQVKENDINNELEIDMNREMIDFYKDKNKDEDIKKIENNEKEEVEEQEQEEGNNKRKTSKIIIGILALIFIVSAIIINSTVSKYNNVVYPGAYIYGEDVSKLNKDELNLKIINIKEEINKRKIKISAKENMYEMNMKDVTENYNENKLYDEILYQYKDKNILEKFITIVSKKRVDYVFDIEVNKKLLEQKLEDISKDTNKKCEEVKVIINGEDIQIKEGQKGLKLDNKNTISDIEKNIKEKSVYSSDVNISCKYVDDNPKIDMKELSKVNHKISTYTTTYSPGGGRGSNVEIAAKKIDDMLLMPGDEFSYQESVGPVTQSNGYTYAPVISNGELVQGIGGGVCQVSSTLYNTQLKAGILPTERRNHSKAVNYVPRGLDATLATGSIDYKFKNTHEYPIVINTNTGGGRLTIEFWSNEDALKGIEYKPVGYASGKTANTYLYGYDKEGKQVYEKHIDTSIYR